VDRTVDIGTYETDLSEAYLKTVTEEQDLLKELSTPQNDDFLGATKIERYNSQKIMTFKVIDNIGNTITCNTDDLIQDESEAEFCVVQAKNPNTACQAV
jgi:hypothetical protein